MITNVADLQDPFDPKGRTYRQVNAECKHKIELGQLVESKLLKGVRLYVVQHTRDCDQAPLYTLGPEPGVIYDKDEYGMFLPEGWITGFSEEDLTIIPTLEK